MHSVLKMDKGGHVIVDEYQNTSVDKIYALGDVCGKALLTPGKLYTLYQSLIGRIREAMLREPPCYILITDKMFTFLLLDSNDFMKFLHSRLLNF
jgi:hypothetical protein